jgi:methylamine utilization protein MauE
VSAHTVLACRLLIGLVLIASAASKLRSRDAYAAFVGSTRALVPAAGRVTPAVAAATVAAELGIALLLVPQATYRFAALAAVALLSAFTVALAAAVRRGVRTPCRCFGASAEPPGGVQLVRNAVLIVLAAVAASLPAGDPVAAPGVAIAAFAAVTGAILVISADDLAVLVRPVNPGSTT